MAVSSVSVHEHRCLMGLYLQPRSLPFYLYSSQISLSPVSNTSPNFIISRIELLSPSKPLPPENKTETGLVLFQGLHSVSGPAVQPSRYMSLSVNVTLLSCPCPWKDCSLAVPGFDLLFCIPTTHWFSVQFSRSVVSDSLRPHESQHTKPPCSSPSPRVHSDSRPSSP